MVLLFSTPTKNNPFSHFSSIYVLFGFFFLNCLPSEGRNITQEHTMKAASPNPTASGEHPWHRRPRNANTNHEVGMLIGTP